MRGISTLTAGTALAAALAGAFAGRVLSYPDDGGPFEGGRRPRVFRIYPCAVVDRTEPAEDGGVPTATFARSDGRPRSARMRLSTPPSPAGLHMSVTSPGGEVLAGPEQISGTPEAMFAFWADVNGDKKEDFIALVWSAKSGSNLGFALSSKRGYRITSIMSQSPASADFIDPGDGKCRVVQTALVRSGTGGATAREFWVYNLLEFDGDRLKVSKAGGRFPRWVPRPRRVTSLAEPDATRPRESGRGETARLSPEQKSRLWSAVPERIFWRPRRVASLAEPDATRPRRAALSKEPDATRPRRAALSKEPGPTQPPEATRPVLASAGD